MIAVVPWENRGFIEAAVDLVGKVRDESPMDLCQYLQGLPPYELANVAIVLAAMVDADRPLSGLRRWELPGFVGPGPDGHRERAAFCKRDHLMDALNTRIEANGCARCRTCDRERAARKRMGKPSNGSGSAQDLRRKLAI